MADVFTKKKRSQIMSSIRGIDTTPELIVRKFLHSQGIRYGLHDKKLPGKPDLKLTRFRTIVFVNGCFWHGHSCKSIPKTNRKFWLEKIKRNKERDKAVKRKLRKMGWRVMEVWQCELKAKRREITLKKLYEREIANN
jgi:DNA mismatch endonuclease (patch repair protein)